jgi:hypothetical protein
MVNRTLSVITGWLVERQDFSALPRASNLADARYWPLADIPSVAFEVAFGGKADFALHVCF